MLVNGNDLDKVRWEKVTYNEYLAKPVGQVSRVTYLNNTGLNIYEVGTLPAPMPTKRGAIIVPTRDWLVETWDVPSNVRPFFVYDGENWIYQSIEDMYIISHGEVQEALNAGATVAFAGID